MVVTIQFPRLHSTGLMNVLMSVCIEDLTGVPLFDDVQKPTNRESYISTKQEVIASYMLATIADIFTPRTKTSTQSAKYSRALVDITGANLAVLTCRPPGQEWQFHWQFRQLGKLDVFWNYHRDSLREMRVASISVRG